MEWKATVGAPEKCYVRPVSSDSRVSLFRSPSWLLKIERKIERIRGLFKGARPAHDIESCFGLKKPIESIYSFTEVLDFCSLDSKLPLIAKLTKPKDFGDMSGGTAGTRAHGAPYQNLPIAQSL